MKQKNTHNGLVKLIKEEFRSREFNNIRMYEEYSQNGACGELDLYAKVGKYILLVEVKSTDNKKARKRAKEQLYRAETHYFKNKRVFKFYAYNSNNKKGYKIENVMRKHYGR